MKKKRNKRKNPMTRMRTMFQRRMKMMRKEPLKLK